MPTSMTVFTRMKDKSKIFKVCSEIETANCPWSLSSIEASLIKPELKTLELDTRNPDRLINLS